MRRGAFFALSLGLGIMLAACSSGGSLPEVSVESPTATAYSWFRAINQDNLALAQAHFEPTSRSQMHWSDFGSIQFTDVSCSPRSVTTTNADVRCAFDVPNPPADLQGDHFWDVWMQRKASGPWLISSYGQG
jgi:hypothetical protein